MCYRLFPRPGHKAALEPHLIIEPEKFNVMFLLFQLLAVGVFFGAITLHLLRRPIVLLYLLLAVQFLVAGHLMPEISARVMGVAIGPVDVINMIMLAVAILRMKRGPSGLQWALLGAIGLIIYGTLTGFLRLGDAAMLGFRAELYFLVPALFVSTISVHSLPKVVRAIVWFGAGLGALAVFRWVGVVPAPEAQFAGDYLIERVITSSAALWVAFAALGAVFTLFHPRGKRATGYPWYLSALCLPVVLFTQHRSVWVASAVMLAMVFLITQQRTSLKVAAVLMAGIAVTLIELLDLGHGGTATESLAYAMSNLATWEWRIERWGNIWETHAARGWGAIFLGSGYGYGWVTGSLGTWEVSPHNGFLQIAVRIGLVGAFLVFLPYYFALRTLLISGDSTSRLLWLWSIGVLVYFIPYSGDMLTGVILGAAIAALRSRVITQPPAPRLADLWTRRPPASRRSH